MHLNRMRICFRIKMICPHCKNKITLKELKNCKKQERRKREMKKENLFKKIISEINKNEHSISSLQKELNMKRSTLVYYLEILIEHKKIYMIKKKNYLGKPILLKSYEDLF